MLEKNHFSREVTIFHGKQLPEIGKIVGYAAIIDTLQIPVTIPHSISLISTKKQKIPERRLQGIYTQART